MGEEESNSLYLFNPAQKIAEEITLKNLISHKDACQQCKTGVTKNIKPEDIDALTYNDKQINRVRALNLIISSQRDLILNARAIIKFNSEKDYKKNYLDKEKKDQLEFEKWTCDYNKVMKIDEYLTFLEREIINADLSVEKNDDFLKEVYKNNEKRMELTDNFFDMRKELEDSFENIYSILLKNRILTGLVKDEDEKTEEEVEKEAMRRVMEG